MPFAGSLGTLPLPDILNTLHNIHASGVLRLVSRVGSRDVVFQAGEIIGVGHLDQESNEAPARRLSLLSPGAVEEGEQAEDVRQEEALSQVFNLFAWNDADFAFAPTGPEAPEIQQLVAVCQVRPLNLNIQHVLMEAARQQDEWAALRARIQQESSGKGTAAISQPSPAEDLSVEVGPPEEQQEPVVVPAPRSEDREWEKPILSDEELAPTPWGDGTAPAAGQVPAGAITTSTAPPTTTFGGATLGPYRVSPGLELLNGTAHRGRHLQERATEVAIKLGPAELFRGEAGLNEALHQARLLAAVHHPSLLPCLGVGPGGGGLYAAFAPRPGEDLAQVVERSGGPLAESAVIRVALDCAFALQALHHRALVHRDLRPDNVFVAEDGRALLGPFALVDAPAADQEAPERGRLVAEPGACTAPEVLQRVIDVDHRADLYALGCVIYFLATGQPPFHGANRQDLARSIQGRPVPRIRELNRHIGEGLDAVVAATMAKDRGQRPHSIDALIADLQVLDVSQAPGGAPFADEDSSASTYPAVSTGVLVAGPPMTRRQASTTSARMIASSSLGGTTGVARRSSTRITAVMPASGDSARRAVVPQPQPITSILVQPPAEPPPMPVRSWGVYDLALVVLVATTVFWVVTTQTSATAPAASPNAVVAPVSAPRLPHEGHRLRFQGDEWAAFKVEPSATVGPQGAVFRGAGALRALRPPLVHALAAAGDFTIAIQFTAAQAGRPGESVLLAIARTPVIANLVVAQNAGVLTVRLRTSDSDASGVSVVTPSGLVTGQRQRLVFVRRNGRGTIYLDGAAVAWKAMPGDLSTWDEGCPLLLGNDPQGGAPWAGVIHDVTVWSRPLASQDIAAFDAGPELPQ